MTREEQAQYIAEKLMENPEFRKAFLGAITNAVNEAVKVIKSLQQEPCEDVISRAEALKHSVPIFDDDGVGYMVVRADKIEQLPLVTPQPKIGKWITVDKGLKVTSYKCSECGRIERDDTGYDVTKDYPYCHCGAKMQEVEE